jgi:hypothetical protein
LNTKLILAAIGLGAGCLLQAAEALKPGEYRQSLQLRSKTEHVDFPSGGTLRFVHSIGVLTVEAWDQAGLEITTVKSTKADIDPRDREKATRDLEKISVATERHGDELVFTTKYPAHRPFRLPYPLSGNTSYVLEYRIKAPANTRIVAEHGLGDVNVDGLTSDIQVKVAQGEILLHLPEDGKYSIHAKSDFGSVNSDFSELEKRTGWFLGHGSDLRNGADNSAAAHKLDLKVVNGDIVILRIHTPKFPDETAPAQKKDGL